MNLSQHLEKLPLLIAVSQTGSLRQAGFRLKISQPAVTRSLRILEDACGGELVKRTQKGAKLTPRGYEVLALAKEIDECVYKHASRIEALDHEVHGRIEIGTYESIAVYAWPSILNELQRVLPNVQVSMRTDRSDGLIRALVKGDFDLVVSVAPKPRRGVMHVELYRDHFELYVADGIDLSSISTVIIFEDVIAPFVSKIWEAARRHGIRADRKVLTDSFEVVRAMTVAGVGFGVMPTKVAGLATQLAAVSSLRAVTPGSLKPVSEQAVTASYLASRRGHPVISNVLRVVQAKLRKG